MTAAANSEDGDIGFQIAPMVDVVFVLMLFFMACAGSRVKLGQLEVPLPHGGPGAPAVIEIQVAADGSVFMNGQAFGAANDRMLPALSEWLRDLRARFGTDDPVVIRPDATTPYQRVIDVLNATSAAGVKKLTFG